MQSEIKNIPTYGSVAACNAFEHKMKRKNWLKENKAKLIALVSVIAVVVAATIIVALK